MVSLALINDYSVSSRPSLPTKDSDRRKEPEGEIGRTLRQLSSVHLRAALYRFRFGNRLGHGRLSEIEERLTRLGAVERIADGSLALLDIGPAAASAAAGEIPEAFHAGLASLLNWHELGTLEIAACCFWTDEVVAGEPPLPNLQ